ncbi:ATP-dependent DNA ligase [Microbacterium sp. LWO14-1.2]|uniref:DUF7882 family protein n=1 Tax=Microbacterium sp. LWO14-1.2 TaxID=3135263 RepID=UPI0031391325
MGMFIYEGGPRVDIDDRALLHLQLVMAAKLGRGEPFSFSWRNDLSVGGGTSTVWIQPHTSMVFKYDREVTLGQVNRAWIDALAFTASSPAGLRLTPEPHGASTLDQDLDTVGS